MRFIDKIKGGHPLPAPPHWSSIAWACAGSLVAVGLLAWLSEQGVHPWLLGSFSASCILLFAYPDSPFSQPRNLVLGHTLSTLIGLSVLTLAGPHWWSMALAVTLAIACMMRLGVMHPPAGSNPLIVMSLHPGWSFALMPSLAGSVVLVLLGLLIINLKAGKHYPRHW